MTLIGKIHGPGLGLLAFSDVITSRPETADGAPLTLPSRSDPTLHVNAGYQVSGITRKVVIADKTFIQWAGSVACARVAITAIMAASDNGKNSSEIQVILEKSGLSKEELESISIIYSFFEADGVRTYWHNCQGYKNGPFTACVSGSGVWDFMENTNISSKRTPTVDEIISSVMMRVGYHTILDANTGSNYDFMYGGWMEAFINDGDFLREIPYAIKFWDNTEKGLFYNLPAMFCWYEEGDLIVCRVDYEGEKSKTKVHRVQQIINHKNISDIKEIIPNGIKWNPDVVFHVVRQLSGKMAIYMDRGNVNQLNITAGLGDTGMTVNRSFVDKMAKEEMEGFTSFDIKRSFN